jgi:AcrR family transcriptional regulator
MTADLHDDVLDDSADLDGRHARRQRNRDAVVDAIIELHREGNLDPSSVEIAERAGLSARSIFRYFDDRDDLYRAAFERQQERVQPLLPIEVAAGAPLEDRIAAVVEQRLRLFDAVGQTAFASRLRAPFQPVIAENLSQGRAFFRSQLKKAFASELTAMPAAQAGALLAAIDVLCSYESYHLMRHDQSLSRARTAAALTTALTTMLGGQTP